MEKIVQPLVNELHQNSLDYLKQPIVQPLNFSGYQKYLDSGNRIDFENEYFARRRQLAVLALDYLTYPDDATKILLENVIWEICNEYTWALPAHMPITADTFGKDSPRWIDLFGAETGEALAEIQELIGAHLTPQINQRIDEEIERRIFTPFEDHDWSWQYKDNNWSAVIGGSLGITTLIKLQKNSVRQKRMLKRLDVAFQTYLSSFGEDGACVEGVSYWAYGFGYYIYFADKIKQVLGNTSYLDNPKVRKIAEFPFYTEMATNSFLPFSDAANIELPTGLLSYCQNQFHVDVPEFKQVNQLDFDNCYRFAQLYRNLIWTSQYQPTSHKTLRTHYFPNVQWLFERSDQDDFIFAAKGGHNDESHNHIDLGHFIFGTTEQLFLTDLGAGEYTKDYFNDDKRYNYLTPSARSHSIPTINDDDELFGAYSSTSDFDEIKNVFTLNLEKTYPDEAKISAFIRRFKISPNQRQLQLTDDFILTNQQNEIQEHFITTIKPIIKDNQVTLANNHQTCTLTFNSQQISSESLTYSDHNAVEQTVYRINVSYSGEEIISAQVAIQIH